MTEHPSFRKLPPGEPIAGKTYRADGWAYIDPPGLLSPKRWDQLLLIIGAGQYVILTKSEGIRGGIPFVRGQLLVSPAGIENMRAVGRIQ